MRKTDRKPHRNRNRWMIMILSLCFMAGSHVALAAGTPLSPLTIQGPGVVNSSEPVYHVRDYGAVGNGQVDDTQAIQQALDDAGRTGGTVYFPPGRYPVRTLTVYGNHLTLLGHEATIVSLHPPYPVKYDADTLRERSLLRTDLARQTLFARIPYERDIRRGQTVLPLPPSVDMNKLQRHDLVMITTAKGDPWAPSYKYGSLRYILSMDKKKRTITLDSGVETSLQARKGYRANDDLHLYIYRPVQHFRMAGLTFELMEDGRQNGVCLDFIWNADIRQTRFIGKGQNLTGLSISGFYLDIAQIYAEGFLSREEAIGYGVNVAGHQIKVHDSFFIHGKHAISGADRRFRNSHLAYYRNTVIDPQSAALDVHGTGEQIRIYDNIIRDVGKTFPGCGIWARGRGYEIYRNQVEGVPKKKFSTCGIKILESAVRDLRIFDNSIAHVTYGFQSDVWTKASGKITVTGNRFENVDTGIFISHLPYAEITDNTIAAIHNGVIVRGGHDISISRNRIHHHLAFGILLEGAPAGRTIGKGYHLADNLFIPGSGANNSIRIQPYVDEVTITGNRFDTIRRVGPAINIQLAQATHLRHAVMQNNETVSPP